MATPKKEVLNVQDELRKELAGLKDKVDPPSGFMINLKGKVFTLPNGSASDGPLTCVILDWVSENTFFEGIYNPKDIKPPVCFAVGAAPLKLVPSTNATKPQHANCKDCPMNEWGSDPKGGKGKACKNTRRILVVPIDAEPGAQPWIIKSSPTSLKHFDKYVNSLSDVGTHPIECVTDISFEASESYPSLRFKIVDKHDNLDVMWGLKQAGQEILLQEPNPKE